MENLFLLLSSMFLLAIPIGLINPTWIIKWGEEKTRVKVIRYCGIGLWASLALAFGFSEEIAFTQALGVISMLGSIIALMIGLINPITVVAWGPEEERNRKKVCISYSIGMIASIIVIISSLPIQQFIEAVGALIIVGLIIALIVGMIRPDKLPTFKLIKKRTRKAILKSYGIALVVVCTIYGANVTSESITQVASQDIHNITSSTIQDEEIAKVEKDTEQTSIELIEEQNEVEDNQSEEQGEVQLQQEEHKEQLASNEKVEDTVQEIVVNTSASTVENTSNQVKQETLKVDIPNTEASKVEKPTVEVPKAEAPKVEKPTVESSKSETQKVESSTQTKPPVVQQVTGNSNNISNENIVYWVSSGEVYHSTKNCSTLSRSKNIYSGTISESGKTRHCKRC